MSEVSLIDPKADIWFGFPGSELSYSQKRKAMIFDAELTPWLIENVGEFGTVWWAEIDKDSDSLRAVFKDPAMETWVLMKWCDEQEVSG
jgi:hypothetical protein